MHDALVIGGGPAGLQATLTLGRMHRPTLMLDSGAYRNAPVDAMHNIITNDGRDPAEFRSIVRAELRRTARWRSATSPRRPSRGWATAPSR